MLVLFCIGMYDWATLYLNPNSYLFSEKKMAVRKRPIEDTRRYNMRIPQMKTIGLTNYGWGRFVLEIGQEGPHLRSKIAVVHAEASAKIKD